MNEPSSITDLPLEALVGCPECDLLLQRTSIPPNAKALCPRCGCELYTNRRNVISRSLALVSTALVLFVPANFLPIMHLDLLGQYAQETVWDGVLGLYSAEMEGIAVVVFLCSLAIPLIKLLCQFFVLLTIRSNVGRRHGLLLYRSYHHMREWGMLEVYFMGVLVAIVKLADLAQLHVGTGLFCFIALLLVQVWLDVEMAPQQIWDALTGEHPDACT